MVALFHTLARLRVTFMAPIPGAGINTAAQAQKGLVPMLTICPALLAELVQAVIDERCLRTAAPLLRRQVVTRIGQQCQLGDLQVKS
ncbi:hypothetical protein D3C77_541600 [compost metagenome]